MKKTISFRYYFQIILTVILFPVLILAISSCKKYDIDSWPIQFPEELEYEIQLFTAYAPHNLQVKPLSIILTTNLYHRGTRVAGLTCHNKKIIYLDTTSNMWNEARTCLVMHELGHYVLKRQHFNDTTIILDTWESFPISFMNIGKGKPSDWNLKRDDLLEYYLNELFYPQ